MMNNDGCIFMFDSVWSVHLITAWHVRNSLQKQWNRCPCNMYRIWYSMYWYERRGCRCRLITHSNHCGVFKNLEQEYWCYFLEIIFFSLNICPSRLSIAFWVICLCFYKYVDNNATSEIFLIHTAHCGSGPGFSFKYFSKLLFVWYFDSSWCKRYYGNVQTVKDMQMLIFHAVYSRWKF